MARSKKQEFFPKHNLGKVKGFSIHIQDIRYYGVHQGFKIWVNGIKYPIGRGQFYTTENQNMAIENAINSHLHTPSSSIRPTSLLGGKKRVEPTMVFSPRVKLIDEGDFKSVKIDNKKYWAGDEVSTAVAKNVLALGNLLYKDDDEKIYEYNGQFIAVDNSGLTYMIYYLVPM